MKVRKGVPEHERRGVPEYEERKGLLDYGAQVLCIFGFSTLCMLIFTALFGESAREVSSFFVLGREGIPLAVLGEFLLLAVIIVFLQFLFFTDCCFRKMPVIGRTVLMLLSILAVMSGFIAAFDWFPVRMWQPWVMFLLCFLLCFGGSLGISVAKTRLENRRLQEGLERLRGQEESVGKAGPREQEGSEK